MKTPFRKWNPPHVPFLRDDAVVQGPSRRFEQMLGIYCRKEKKTSFSVQEENSRVVCPS